ncbi:MAG: hypothetical protein ACK6BM_01315 [Cyanobacteriota bacterium]
MAEFVSIPLVVAAFAFFVVRSFDSNLEHLCLVPGSAQQSWEQDLQKTKITTSAQTVTRYERRRHLLDDAVKVSGLLAAFAALLKFNHENARTRKERSIAHIDAYVDDFSQFELETGKKILRRDQVDIDTSSNENNLEHTAHLLRHSESIALAVRIGVIDQVVATDLLEDIFPMLLGYSLPLIYQDLRIVPGPTGRKDTIDIEPNSPWCEFRMFCRILKEDRQDDEVCES